MYLQSSESQALRAPYSVASFSALKASEHPTLTLRQTRDGPVDAFHLTPYFVLVVCVTSGQGSWTRSPRTRCGERRQGSSTRCCWQLCHEGR